MSGSISFIELVNKTLKNLKNSTINKLEDWGKIVQLSIDDEDFFINFKEIKLKTLVKGYNESYDFKLSTSYKIFDQIIHNELNPVEAVVSGEVAIEGSLTDALEFSEMMSKSQD